MRRLTNALLLTILFGLPLTTACSEPTQAPLTGTVTWIYDGDTIEVAPHGKVRLIGIDCPERQASKRDNKFVELGADPQRLRQTYHDVLRFSIDMIKGQTVRLTPDREPRDRHGRLLAYVTLANGRDLNRLLLEEGYAVVYRRFPFARKQDYLAAETKAREEGKGLWSKTD